MRVCWNWQTGTFEGRVLHDVRVQVPSLAPTERLYRNDTAFFRMILKKMISLLEVDINASLYRILYQSI